MVMLQRSHALHSSISALVWDICKAIEVAKDLAALKALLQAAAVLFTLSDDEIESVLQHLSNPTLQGVKDKLHRLYIELQTAASIQDAKTIIQQAAREEYEAYAQVLLTVVAPDWLPCLSTKDRSQLFDNFFFATPAPAALSVLTRHLSQVVPVQEAPQHNSSTIVAAIASETASQLVRTRFTVPDSTGVRELLLDVASSAASQASGKADEAFVGTWMGMKLTIEQIAGYLVSLPDRLAAAAADVIPAQFCSHVLQQLFLSLADVKLSWESGLDKDMATKFVAVVLQRMVTRGHLDDVSKWLIDCVTILQPPSHTTQGINRSPSLSKPQQADALDGLKRFCSTCECAQSLQHAVSDVLKHAAGAAGAVEKVLEQMLLKLSENDTSSSRQRSVQLMKVLVKQELFDQPGVRYHLTERLLLHTTLPPAALETLLTFLLDMDPTMWGPLTLQLAKFWGDEHTTQRVRVPRQAYISTALVWCLQHSCKADLEGAPDLMSAIIQGISKRLGSPLKAVRRQAMHVGYTFSLILDPSQPLFEEQSPCSLGREELWSGAQLLSQPANVSSAPEYEVVSSQVPKSAESIASSSDAAPPGGTAQQSSLTSRTMPKSEDSDEERMSARPSALPTASVVKEVDNSSKLTAHPASPPQFVGGFDQFDEPPQYVGGFHQVDDDGKGAAHAAALLGAAGRLDHHHNATTSLVKNVQRFDGDSDELGVNVMMSMSGTGSQAVFADIDGSEDGRAGVASIMSCHRSVMGFDNPDGEADFEEPYDSDQEEDVAAAAWSDPDSESDSDDEFQPYDLDEEDELEEWEKGDVPPSLRSVAAALRKQDDVDTVLAALRKVEVLIRANPDELAASAGELSRSLLHCRVPEWAETEADEQGTDRPEVQRVRGLVALLAQVPEQAGKALIPEVYSPHVDMMQRLTIMDALCSAARELAFPPSAPRLTFKNKVPQVTDPSSNVHSSQATSTRDSMLGWESRPMSASSLLSGTPSTSQATTGPSSSVLHGSKTRVWGHTSLRKRGEKPRVVWQNKFLDVVMDWTVALVKEVDVAKHGVDMFGRDSLLLGRLLTTLGTFAECLVNTPAINSLAAVVLELIQAQNVHNHDEPFVRRSALLAASQVLASISASALTDDSSLLMLEWLSKTHAWAAHIADSDPDPTSQCLAVSCCQLYKAIVNSALISHQPDSTFVLPVLHRSRLKASDIIVPLTRLHL